MRVQSMNDVQLIAELTEALQQQTDNMAFILNRVSLLRWHEQFDTELAEARTTLTEAQQYLKGTTHDKTD